MRRVMLNHRHGQGMTTDGMYGKSMALCAVDCWFTLR